MQAFSFVCDDTLCKLGGLFASFTIRCLKTIDSWSKIWPVKYI